MILTLLLLTLPADIKAATTTHLQALQTISATEKVLDHAYSVAFYENRQQTDSPPHFHGPTFKSAWFELLRESLFWHYEEAGEADAHFTFKDRCAWMEKGRVIVPCSGKIFNKNLNVSAIIVRYETKRWGTVELRVDYDFVTLSEPRLVAKTGYLRWGDHETKVEWTDYREFRGNEPKITEIDDDQDTQTKPHVTAQPKTAQSATDAARDRSGNPLQEGNDGEGGGIVSIRPAESLPITNTAVQRDNMATQSRPADLLTPAQGEIKSVKVHKSWWKIWRTK